MVLYFCQIRVQEYAPKKSYNNHFIVVDSAMNDMLRPALYDANHEIIAVKEINKEKEISLIEKIAKKSVIYNRR